jgi:hypothetical protein
MKGRHHQAVNTFGLPAIGYGQVVVINGAKGIGKGHAMVRAGQTDIGKIPTVATDGCPAIGRIFKNYSQANAMFVPAYGNKTGDFKKSPVCMKKIYLNYRLRVPFNLSEKIKCCNPSFPYEMQQKKWSFLFLKPIA